MIQDVRAAAAEVIGAVINGQSLNEALPQRMLLIRARDRSLLQQLCYGTLRFEPRLQALLNLLLDKPLREKDRDLQGLMLSALHQLDNTRVPDHAAVAASVEATRALNKPWARGMVNAILRRYLRERDQLAALLEPHSAAAHPRWLYHRISAQWPADAAAIMAVNNQQPPMCVRVNTLLSSVPDYLAELSQQGVAATAGQLSTCAVQLAQPVDVQILPGFAEGRVSVQDEAAQLAAVLLQPGPGERILDACAAPGGKTCHILELQPALAELVAMDVDAKRLQRVDENLRRLHLQATLLVGDAALPPAQLAPESFDRILVDAPCSASGVIRRHPDIKQLRRENDIPQFAAQQLQILRGVWPLLKPGGSLLYVTCSLLHEENSAVVRGFLDEQPAAVLSPIGASWGREVACGRQLLPVADGADGLFYALLRKPSV